MPPPSGAASRKEFDMNFKKIAALVKGRKVIYDFQKSKEGNGFIFRLMSPQAAFLIPVNTDRLPEAWVGIAQPDVNGELDALFQRHINTNRPYSLSDSSLTYKVYPPRKTLVILEGRKADHDTARIFLLDKCCYDLVSDTQVLALAPLEPGPMEFVCTDGVAFFMPYKLEQNQAENLRDRAKTITEYYRYYGKGL